MQKRKIYILTGAIRSGKTSKLMEWSAKRKDVFGILTPDVSGKKVFMNVHTGEQFEMEADPGESETLRIGKFIFSKRNFARAIEILRQATKEKGGWLVVDEIGPLELGKEGFYEVMEKIFKKETKPNILLVIRNNMLDKAIEFFRLDKFNSYVIEKDEKFLSPL